MRDDKQNEPSATRSAALYVRLAVASVDAVSSTLFVAVYSLLCESVVPARVHFTDWPHLMMWFPRPTYFVIQYSWYAFSVPACLLVLGIFALRRWKGGALFELAVGCQWLFALLWALFCLLVWILPEVPVTGGLH